MDENAISYDPNIDKPIVVENATFSWNRDESPTLKNISVEIKPKKLVAIVGQIGSGKSSFLSAILGDMQKINGFVNINVSCLNYHLFEYIKLLIKIVEMNREQQLMYHNKHGFKMQL